jgi:hypothetical protein
MAGEDTVDTCWGVNPPKLETTPAKLQILNFAHLQVFGYSKTLSGHLKIYSFPSIKASI